MVFQSVPKLQPFAVRPVIYVIPESPFGKGKNRQVSQETGQSRAPSANSSLSLLCCGINLDPDIGDPLQARPAKDFHLLSNWFFKRQSIAPAGSVGRCTPFGKAGFSDFSAEFVMRIAVSECSVADTVRNVGIPWNGYRRRGADIQTKSPAGAGLWYFMTDHEVYIWCVLTGSNRRHSACKADALPTELRTLGREL